ATPPRCSSDKSGKALKDWSGAFWREGERIDTAERRDMTVRYTCLRPLLLLLLLSAFTRISDAEGDFDDDFDDGVYAGDLALDRRAEGSQLASASNSAELAGEAALGGLRRRLELDEALTEAVRAGRTAVRKLRRQAHELRRLRAENTELRSVAATAAAAAEAAADVTEAAEAPDASPPKRAAAVAPPPQAAENAARDRDLRRLAGMLARHDAEGEEAAEAEGGACFPAGTPLANCAQVRRRFGLAMDAEAAALCDSHRLCAACAGHYGIEAGACDRAFVTVAADLCLRESEPVTCGRQADALLAAVRAAHAPADPVAADVIGCSRPCAARLLATVRGN
ncbi:hypothetical protein BOX15_Mlig014073g3, partial [Macrostomum lignano]